jgi:hypothetical protein
MTARHGVAAAAAWLVLVGVSLAVADGETPVMSTVAAVGIVLLVANARGIARRRPAPLIEGGSAHAETFLGASLVALAIAGAFGLLTLGLALGALAVVSAGWMLATISKSH